MVWNQRKIVENNCHRIFGRYGKSRNSGFFGLDSICLWFEAVNSHQRRGDTRRRCGLGETGQLRTPVGFSGRRAGARSPIPCFPHIYGEIRALSVFQRLLPLAFISYAAYYPSPVIAQTKPGTDPVSETAPKRRPDAGKAYGREFEREENWVHWRRRFFEQRAYPSRYIRGGARLQALEQTKHAKPFAMTSAAGSGQWICIVATTTQYRWIKSNAGRVDICPRR
jgi:hypothetical protein